MKQAGLAQLDPAFQKVLNAYDEAIPLKNEHGNNHRYQYAKARRGAEWFFLKYACGDDEVHGLERERKWSHFMAYIEAEYPDAGLVGLPIVETSGNAMVFAYVDSPLVADASNATGWRQHMQRYAETLAVLDRASLSWPGDDIVDVERRADTTDEVWQRWLSGSGAKIERLDEAHTLVASRMSKLRQVMQHGDLQPWQIFDLSDQWMIYDGERSGTDLLRYNDLAYGVGRLYTKLHSPDGARELMHHFLMASGADPVVFWREFQLVLVGRAVGMLSDAWQDKPSNDYVHLASRLLDIALDGPERLIG